MSTICRVGIFIICAQTIIHFRPKPVFEKYLKLLLGVMILVQLLLPLQSFLQKMDGGEFLERVFDFQKNVELHFEEIVGETFTVTLGEIQTHEGKENVIVGDSVSIPSIRIAPVRVEVD